MFHPLDPWYADNPLYRRARRGSWWNRANEELVPLILLGACYFGLLVDWIDPSTRGSPNPFATIPLAIGTVGQYLAALVGIPRLAADLFGPERRSATWEMLVVTPYPRRALLLGALAGKMRGQVMMLLLSLPAWMLLGLRFGGVLDMCGFCTESPAENGHGALSGLLAWFHLVGVSAQGAGLGVYFGTRMTSPNWAASLAQMAGLALCGAPRIGIVLLLGRTSPEAIMMAHIVLIVGWFAIGHHCLSTASADF